MTPANVQTLSEKWAILESRLAQVKLRGLSAAVEHLRKDVEKGEREYLVNDLLRRSPEDAAGLLVKCYRSLKKVENWINKAKKEPKLLAVDATAIAPSKDQLSGQAEKNVAKLIEKLGLSSALFASQDFHVRLNNEPYEPLVIEKHGSKVYLTHYYEQNSDLVMDGEMVYTLHTNGQLKLSETAVQNPFRGGESRIRNGGDRKFATVFARNVLNQGFDKPDSVEGSNAEAIVLNTKAN